MFGSPYVLSYLLRYCRVLSTLLCRYHCNFETNILKGVFFPSDVRSLWFKRSFWICVRLLYADATLIKTTIKVAEIIAIIESTNPQHNQMVL